MSVVMTVSTFASASAKIPSRANAKSDGERTADCAYWRSMFVTFGRLPTVPAIATYTWFSTARA